jgi:hypothetical protein
MRIKHDLQQMVSTRDRGESWKNLTVKIVSYDRLKIRRQQGQAMIGRQVPGSRVEYAPRELLSERDGVNVHRQTLASNKLRHRSQS